MCGRYNLDNTTEVDTLLRQHGFQGKSIPSFNIAPTDLAPIIVQDRHRKSDIIPARWWLTPSWSTGPSQKFAMFNATCENLQTSKAFKGPFEHKRCIVPASSFIEWRGKGEGKQALDVALPNTCLAMAGIWDCWQEGEQQLYSFAIITKPASASFSEYHHRMPVLLNPPDHASWLDPKNTGRDVLYLIDNSIGAGFQLTPLENDVGNAKDKSKPRLAKQASLF